MTALAKEQTRLILFFHSHFVSHRIMQLLITLLYITLHNYIASNYFSMHCMHQIALYHTSHCIALQQIASGRISLHYIKTEQYYIKLQHITSHHVTLHYITLQYNTFAMQYRGMQCSTLQKCLQYITLKRENYMY